MALLNITPTREAGVFALSGSIVANMDFSQLLQDPSSHLVLLFSTIREITSNGIKKWMEGIQLLQKNGKTIEYRNCPEIFVEQCNLIPEMVKNVRVGSFEITFICEECDEELDQMLIMDELDLDDLPPPVPCPSCQMEMITEYSTAFNFMDHALNPSPCSTE